MTPGADASVLQELRRAASAENVVVEVIAPTVAGVELSDGNPLDADQKTDGAPSVLYDAVVVLASDAGVATLAADAAARDFVNDAFAHYKFIGYTKEALVLFDATGIRPHMDDGFVEIGSGGASAFLAACRAVRYWDRPAAAGSTPGV